MDHEYVISLIENNTRIDGRNFNDYRDIKIETGISKNADGSARCIIGDTEVIEIPAVLNLKIEVVLSFRIQPPESFLAKNFFCCHFHLTRQGYSTDFSL